VRTTTSAPSSTCEQRRSGSTAATSKRHYSARACKCALRVHSGQCHVSASAGRLCRTLFERQRRKRARPPERARAQTRSVLHAPRGSRTSRACRVRGAAERSCPCGGRRGSSCSTQPPLSPRHAVTRRAWSAPHLKRALMAPTTESSLSLQRRVRGGDASAWCWKRWRARRTLRASAVRAACATWRCHASTPPSCSASAERALRPGACWHGVSLACRFGVRCAAGRGRGHAALERSKQLRRTL